MPALDHLRNREWTLSSLVAVLSPLVSALPGAADERVNGVIDERTLRYYQSSGIVDRPLRYDGRAAVYGFRHLLQALATKALQGQGLSLAQVQAALFGVSTAELESAVGRALGSVGAPTGVAPATLVAPATRAAPTPPTVVAPRRLVSAELAPGVTVTVDPSVVADAEELLAVLAHSLTNRSQP